MQVCIEDGEMKTAHKVSQLKTPRTLLDIEAYAVRRASMEAVLADGFDGMNPSPDDLYDLEEHESGGDYGPLPGDGLRDRFLQCPPEKWMSFVFMSGDFDGEQMSQRKFVHWQRILEMALANPARTWRQHLAEMGVPRVHVERLFQLLPVRCDFNAPTPTGMVFAETVLDAMIASVQLAKITKGDFRRCANPTCKKPPFPIGERDREFCGRKCCHAVGQRRRRAEEREAGTASKKKRKSPAKKSVTKKATKRS